MSLLAGTSSTIDLNNSLPTGVARGGVFSIAGSSVRLPAGVALSANGILTVGATVGASVTGGIIFSYVVA